ncbi:MAG: dienelactone hydrolase [Pseudomonadota bacterium]
MRWLRRAGFALIVLVCGVAAAAWATALRAQRPVGFELVRALDAQGQDFAVGVWYPTRARTWPTTLLGVALMDVARDAPVDGQHLPLVLISHGNAGGPGSHADLAMALAAAGYVVAAPMHGGDNYADQSGAASASFMMNVRPAQLRATLDHMLERWPERQRIDRERVGAFGLSMGAFTVLRAVGARPDLGMVARHCAAQPEFVCTLLRSQRSPLLDGYTPAPADAQAADARIKAVVLAAPGLGFTMVPPAVDKVFVPVQLWSGDSDTTAPYASNAKILRAALGASVQFHAVAGVGHLSFLTPCGILAPPALCGEAGDFDRKAFHAVMNASVLAFFDEKLNRTKVSANDEK